MTIERPKQKANILDTICETKRSEVINAKQNISETALLEQCKERSKPRGFINSLKQKHEQNEIGLIAEVKKASPSKGLIRADFNAVEIAKTYEASGASCLSVLTDVEYFQGSNDYLQDIVKNTSIPVLRKDFMIDTYQIIESRFIGADCILLIMDILSNKQASELESLANELGMDVLVEVHSLDELERTLDCLKAPMIGVNNRNLRTLEIDRQMINNLKSYIPEDRLAVCESGIRTHEDILEVQKIDVNCFLVGENLMKQENIGNATELLLGK